MATFSNTTNPTPFAAFDSDTSFQSDADSMYTFVKRKLGDDILSVELTKKQVWACFEESVFEYGKFVNEYMTKSQLSNMLGNPTGSLSGSEARFPRETLEFLMRKAEPYATHASVGGSHNVVSGSLILSASKQDYDIYTSLKDEDGNLIVDNSANSPKSKMRIFEVYHYNPQDAYRFFDTTSAVNYLNNEFAFESFTPETAFYVLPVFEDVLRAGQMNMSNRVRRSHHSYQLIGTKLRIFPRPGSSSAGKKLWLSVGFINDGLNPSYEDGTLDGISSPANIPYGNIGYNNINSMGKQWIRQYTLGGSKEILGLVRSKFSSVPIPNGDLQLNGSDLVSQGREEKDRLRTELREMLDSLTYDKLIETQATEATNLQTILKTVPIPLGKVITVG
tara:strand:+ start:24862 stop:26034 length:1173 start_codon:yes stop_codon:yes gene_type:complete